MTLSDGEKPADRVFTSRTTRLRLASMQKVSELAFLNVLDLGKILKWNANNGIQFFRIGSDIFPFMDHPDKKYSISDLDRSSAIVKMLREYGDFAREQGMRLEMHPGPYNCLGSPSEDVVEKTILSLEMHSMIADLLGYGNDLKINIHVGGTYGGDFGGTANRFCSNFDRLSPNLRARLTVENDDKVGMWTIQHLVDMIHSRIGIPVVFDYHHWMLSNQGESMPSAAESAFRTWGSEIPTTHFSSPREGKNPRAHADFVEGTIDNLSEMIYDVMIEAKQKEIALLRYRALQVNDRVDTLCSKESEEDRKR